jgi:hypothetical protein
VKTLDVEKYPVVGALLEAYDDTKVLNELWGYVQGGAQAGEIKSVDDLRGSYSPEKLLARLSEQYAPLVKRTTERTADPEPIERKAGSTKPRSLRNDMQRSRAPVKPLEDMTPTEQREYYHERARKAAEAVMRRGGAA